MKPSVEYFNSLNTLRAIAVLLVIFQHWLPNESVLLKLHAGNLGVDIFFTLSGYLITNILLNDIENSRARQLPVSRLLGNFFARRVLRIVPAYLLALILTFLLRNWLSPFDAAAWPYLLTFTFNIYVFRLGDWPWTILHYWTLAVEEQFYLCWPLLMVFAGNRSRPFFMGALVVLAVLSRIALSSYVLFDVLTIACLDAFALGGLLAWLNKTFPGLQERYIKHLLFPLILLGIAIPFLNYADGFPLNVLRRFIQSVFAVLLIAYLVYYEKNRSVPLPWFWNNSVLVFLGKISYGMYLYHLLVPYVYIFPWHLNSLFRLIMLITLSWASWKYIEWPLLSLKKKFR